MPASQIYILESQDAPRDGITSTSDSLIGYNYRPRYLLTFNNVCIKKLLALVPSTGGSGIVLIDIEEFYKDKVC
jgi:hypothetical protein